LKHLLLGWLCRVSPIVNRDVCLIRLIKGRFGKIALGAARLAAESPETLPGLPRPQTSWAPKEWELTGVLIQRDLYPRCIAYRFHRSAL